MQFILLTDPIQTVQ